MTLPNLSTERLDQMIHLAVSYKQDTQIVTLPLHQRLLNSLHRKSARLVYGMSAAAVTLSCLVALWLVPTMNQQTEATTGDFSISEYMMQDLLEDLTQSPMSTDLNFQA